MKTAAEYSKDFAAKKAETDATRSRNTLDYDQVEAQEGGQDPSEVTTTSNATSSGFEFNAEDYGLTKTNKKGSPEKGIVTDGLGNYYSIDNYERQQKDDLDTDQGDVFSSDLEKHARKYTDFDPTNFNTSSDVEGALKSLAALNKETEPQAPEEEVYQPSEELAEAQALVSTWDDHILSGGLTQSIYGFNPVTGARGHSTNANWYENYKNQVKENLQPVTINNAPNSETDYSLRLNEAGDKSWIAGQVLDGKKKDKK